MVRGLDRFRAWFAGHADQYILIGGTAASLTMEEAGLDFRATKDLDIVLHVEALTPAFGQAFWDFVQAGGYRQHQADDPRKPIFYRFQKPSDSSFPAMMELFSRAPDSLRAIGGGTLTPIPFDAAVASLSAILLNQDYYRFVLTGRRTLNDLPLVGEDRLIPLKAVAWLELSARRARGEPIDGKTIRKHLNDILRLSQLLTASSRIPLDARIAADMRRFISAASADTSLDPRALGLGEAAPGDLLRRIARAYGLDEDEQAVPDGGKH